ncbi:microfibrillar-associated protein 5 isoform X3 [Loxodonta africana]|uniref:microfibrillar-associated protein 5 isoform X3 n=1 Tax=Loxodonta africana TaxID=9785 RepID=UPI0005404E79|nr:microfibrillar-associated protein 5 isoform X3 [Loxodonta africana]XP_049737456.1 microfibrillar-associated protein 5 isoform X3 [Elephas maximus indicus]
MLLLGPKMLLFLTLLIMPSDWIPFRVNGQRGDDVTPVTPEPFTEDPTSPNDRNTTTECRDEKFPCTRLYSVHQPVKQCIHQLCFTSLRRMYIINNEICSRLVCKEHEAMKDELCRQMAGLPPRRLRRSNYFRLPPCENLDLQRPDGL